LLWCLAPQVIPLIAPPPLLLTQVACWHTLHFKCWAHERVVGPSGWMLHISAGLSLDALCRAKHHDSQEHERLPGHCIQNDIPSSILGVASHRRTRECRQLKRITRRGSATTLQNSRSRGQDCLPLPSRFINYAQAALGSVENGMCWTGFSKRVHRRPDHHDYVRSRIWFRTVESVTFATSCSHLLNARAMSILVETPV
jgi:hypothetical protein